MKDTGEFTGSHSDQIALLYIYLSMIREEVYNYVSLWNTHSIRYQRNQPHLPHGKPIVLYFTPLPGVLDYGVQPPHMKLQELTESVCEWGMFLHR